MGQNVVINIWAKYSKLYDDKWPDANTEGNGEGPPMGAAEVEDALLHMKTRKAPEADIIMVEETEALVILVSTCYTLSK